MTPDLRSGRWQDVLADVECDALICDPPYGARTHNADGARADGARADGARADGLAPTYTHLTPSDVAQWVAHWSSRTRGWMVALACSDLAPVWQDAYFSAGRYGFAPVPCVIRGMSARLAGDGPSSWAVYACVGRPRTAPYSRWGTLPGAYVVSAQQGAGGGRGKPIDLMRALVKDYSRPGDLIVDPCAGYGTTGLAALSMGRRFVGAECDEAAHAEAMRRLSRPTTGDLLAGLG